MELRNFFPPPSATNQGVPRGNRRPVVRQNHQLQEWPRSASTREMASRRLPAARDGPSGPAEIAREAQIIARRPWRSTLASTAALRSPPCEPIPGTKMTPPGSICLVRFRAAGNADNFLAIRSQAGSESPGNSWRSDAPGPLERHHPRAPRPGNSRIGKHGFRPTEGIDGNRIEIPFRKEGPGVGRRRVSHVAPFGIGNHQCRWTCVPNELDCPLQGRKSRPSPGLVEGQVSPNPPRDAAVPVRPGVRGI